MEINTEKKVSSHTYAKFQPGRHENQEFITKGFTGSNSNQITINDNAPANPYPSTIKVSGQTGTVAKVRVSLNGLSHEWPDDLDILLVGPQGQKVMLMSDAGDEPTLYDTNLTFDDSAANSLPDASAISSGTYKPTDYVSGDIFASPAPAGPYGTSLSAFNGTNPNGIWSLYINDDEYLLSGTLDGWSLDLLHSNDAVVNMSVTPAWVDEDTGNKLVYSFTRSGPTTNPLTVNYQVGGTATLNTDYTQSGAGSFNSTSGSITFAAGSSTATLNITPTADAVVEQDESVNLALTSGNGYYANSTATVTSTISDDDAPKSLTLNNFVQGWYDSTGEHSTTNPNYFVGEELFEDEDYIIRNFFVFDVPANISNNIISAELKVNTYEFNSVDASETYELNAVATPIATLTAGGTGLTNIYTDLGDGAVYGSRSFSSADDYSSVSIPLNSNFINALVAAKGTKLALGGEITSLNNLIDNEGVFAFSGENPGTDVQLVINYAPANKTGISISDVTGIEGQTNLASVIVKLSQASATPVTVKYTTVNGTALAGSDYTGKTGTLTFNAGQVSKAISIPVIDNNLSEADEKLKVILSNPSNNGYLTDSEATVTISDTFYSVGTATLTATVENLYLTGNTNINGTGNNNGNLITGNSGKNNLKGLNGNDTLNGGVGNDIVEGGVGNDSYVFPLNGLSGYEQITEATNAGVDTIDLSVASASLKLNLGLNTNQTVIAGQLTVKLSANNVIEKVIAGKGNDLIIGNTLNNNLKGLSGNDKVYGYGGNDTLEGGAGDDLLTGGAGNDSFVYATGKAFFSGDVGYDTINDFSSGDKILLSKTTFSALASIVGNGFSKAGDFAVVGDDAQVATSSARIVYAAGSGSLYYNQNGATAGLGSGAEFATIVRDPALAPSDFAIIV